MPNRRRVIIATLMAGSICILMHILWILSVDPFPSADGYLRYHLPIDRLLTRSLEASSSIFEYFNKSANPGMPQGFILLCLPIILVGLQEFILDFPYTLTLVPLLGLIWSLGNWCIYTIRSPLRIILVFWIIFSFPPIQLSLRTFSPHGFIVLFAMSAIILWYLSLSHKHSNKNLTLSCFFWVLAISTKHLGLFIWLIFTFVWFLWQLMKYPVFRQKHSYALTLIFIFTLFFYSPSEFSHYLESLNSEVPSSRFSGIVLLGTLISISIISLSLIEKSRSLIPTAVLKKLFNLSVPTLLTCYCLFYLDHESDVMEGLRANHYVIAISCLVTWFIARKFHWPTSRFSFLILMVCAQFAGSFFLFESSFGQNHWVFVLPLCLLLTLCSLSSRSIFVTCFFGGVYTITSNFLPDEWTLLNSQYISTSQALYIRDFGDMEHFAYRQDQFLSWNKASIKQSRNAIKKQISKRFDTNIPEDLTGLFINKEYPLKDRLMIYSRTSERMPELLEIDDQQILELLQANHNDLNDLFNWFLNQSESNFIFRFNPKFIYMFKESTTDLNLESQTMDDLKNKFAKDYFNWLIETENLTKHYSEERILNDRVFFYIKNK